ncbi:DUF4176 domain-containing protein [Bacillus sp. Xin]|nr:DUF4176 domain-containing protein [Bacillus sp. Xin]NSW37945.1 DUF4176 domain-containing protein [Bacillus sp. Xin1]
MGQNLELELLPIGSVVMLKDWEHPLMVYGRKQIDSETKKHGIMYVIIFFMVIFLQSIISF